MVLGTAPIGALIARVGDGGWFLVGESLGFEAGPTREGQMSLAFNDRRDYYADNSGSIQALVTISGDSAGPANSPTTETESTAPTPGAPTTTPAPTATRVTMGLSDLIAGGDRTGIRYWAAARSVAQINDAVAGLTRNDRSRLAEVVIDTDASPAERERLLAAMRTVLNVKALGFYAEIWSYTNLSLSGGGFFGTCNQVWLSPSAFDGLDAAAARNTLMHESFHSFNCVNAGPEGALNEGSAIWVFKVAFPDSSNGASFAEATYGTKLYYRDVWQPPQPDYPIGSIGTAATQKLLDVYVWLASADPSLLPWDDSGRLATCYDRYWAGLRRNVDFYSVWIPAEKQATQLMLADPECRPVPPPTGV